MQIRKSHLTGAIVAAAALVAGAVGAQEFEQTVNNALKKDGSIVSQIAGQKQISIQNPDMIEAHAGGGHPGGGHPGGGHENPGRGGGDHRGPGHEQPGRGHEGPEHRVPDHRPDHRPDGDWNRWHGHPGWGGHFHDRWGWDPFGRPLWLGWVIWSGIGRANCLNYYRDLSVRCHADCGAEANACVSNCSIYAPGDGACVASCNNTNVFCNESCQARYEDYYRTCPIF
jgi:hypothetical protein